MIVLQCLLQRQNKVLNKPACRYWNIPAGLCLLTLQLLSSSAVKMMDPHFFPGIPLRAKREKKKKETERGTNEQEGNWRHGIKNTWRVVSVISRCCSRQALSIFQSCIPAGTLPHGCWMLGIWSLRGISVHFSFQPKITSTPTRLLTVYVSLKFSVF